LDSGHLSDLDPQSLSKLPILSWTLKTVAVTEACNNIILSRLSTASMVEGIKRADVKWPTRESKYFAYADQASQLIPFISSLSEKQLLDKVQQV
jgi:hypothetical protein